jgi:hypothetical protein
MAGSPEAFQRSSFQNNAFQTGELVLDDYFFHHHKRFSMFLDGGTYGFKHFRRISSSPSGGSFIFRHIKRGNN